MGRTATIASIFTRYDISAEVARQEARRVSADELLQQVADCVIKGDDEAIESIVKKVLATRSPLAVINEGLIPGMAEVSRLWDAGTYFLPQVILSSDAMNVGISVCEAQMGQAVQKKGKVVTHTAEGDIHDLGQVIVNILLNANGFEVINLGADVPVDDVVAACQKHQPIMVTGTALMTTTMTAFPKIAAKLRAHNLNIPFVCGGGAVSEEFVTSFDMGIWGKEASQAPEMAADALSGMSWEEMRAKWNG
ncbi:MAG TPA: B12-binding domain-containing protein [Anaerolineae bacterium]|nr:B12-binding domain-containing protein [Anaerolineae bacterium]